eukprot:gene8619-17782_t
MSTDRSVDEEIRHRSTRSNMTVYEHIPPRIDQEMFQVDMPPLGSESVTDFPDVNWYKGTYQVHSAKEASSCAAEFLAFSRNISSQWCSPEGYWSDKMSTIPLESDELALEFLKYHDYDIERAKFNLMCSIGQGKDIIFTKIDAELLDKRSTMVLFHETKDRLLRSITPMVGRYQSSDKNSHDYSIPIQDQNILSHGLFPHGVLAIHKLNRKTDNNNNNSYNNNGSEWNTNKDSNIQHEDQSLSSIPTSISNNTTTTTNSNNNNNNKANNNNLNNNINDSKRRTKGGLLSKVNNLLDLPNPPLKDALLVLDEAMADTPSTSTMEHANTLSEDLNVALGELLKLVITTRLWIADVYDTIHNIRMYHNHTSILQQHNNDNINSNNNTNNTTGNNTTITATTDKTSDIEILRALLNEAQHLPLKCGEELQLKRLIRDMEKWSLEAQNFLNIAQSSPLTYFSKYVSICGENSHTLLDSLGISTSTSTSMKSSSSSSIVTNETNQNIKKLKLLELNDILWRSKRIPLPLAEVSQLEAIYFKTQQIIDDVDSFLDTTDAVRTRRNKGTLHRIAYDDVYKLWETAVNFPIQITRTTELKKVLDTGLRWQKEVLEAKGTMPLKKVENLIAVGEKLPFLYTNEMDILQDRRKQARMWLEKLKKSFQKGKPSTRKAIALGDNIPGTDKLQLSDIKEMVCLGEQLYEQQGNKDLNKAQGVLDAAEDVS